MTTNDDASKIEILMPRPMAPRVIEQLDSRFVLHRLWEADDADAFIAELAPRIRGIATGGGTSGRVDRGLIDALPNLEIISSFGVGYDHVDAAHAGTKGIVVTNTPDVLTDEVADLTLGLLLATLRKLPQADRYLREGRWLEKPFPLSPTLRGRTVGILGYGRIGRAIAKRSRRFRCHRRPITGATSRRYAPHRLLCRSRKPWPQDASTSIVINAPAARAAEKLVERASPPSAPQPEGVCQGRAWQRRDEAALIAAPAGRHDPSAGLDVFEKEPRVPVSLELTVTWSIV